MTNFTIRFCRCRPTFPPYAQNIKCVNFTPSAVAFRGTKIAKTPPRGSKNIYFTLHRGVFFVCTAATVHRGARTLVSLIFEWISKCRVSWYLTGFEWSESVEWVKKSKILSKLSEVWVKYSSEVKWNWVSEFSRLKLAYFRWFQGFFKAGKMPKWHVF